jgi:hypothetical protein
MKLFRLICMYSAVVLVAIGCGDPVVASRFVKSQRIEIQGGELIVTAADSAQVAGAKLLVPQGALSAALTITVELAYENLAGQNSGGPALKWGPAGTRFAKPATMAVPLDPARASDEISILVLEADGTSFEIPSEQVEVRDGLAQFAVNGFTRFQPVARRRCTSNSNCAGAQEICVSGRCRLQVADSGVGFGCATSLGCSAGLACVQGVCQGTTVVDDAGFVYDGGGFQRADSGVGFQCVTNSGCAAGLACIGGVCRGAGDGGAPFSGDGGGFQQADSGVGFQCVTNSGCAAGLACIGGVCRGAGDGGAPFSGDGGGFQQADSGVGFQCVTNSGCAAGLACISGICQVIGAGDGGAPPAGDGG